MKSAFKDGHFCNASVKEDIRQSPTYFNKSAGEHLLVNLVLEGKRLLVVVILKATGEKSNRTRVSLVAVMSLTCMGS